MICGYGVLYEDEPVKYDYEKKRQFEALKAAGAKQIIFEERTKNKNNRLELNDILFQLKKGDTLIIMKLEDVALSTLNAIQIVEDLINNGIAVNVLNIGLISNENDKPEGTLIKRLFSAFEQLEENSILKRIESSISTAERRDNWHEDWPAYGIPMKKTLTIVNQQRTGLISIKEACFALKIPIGEWPTLLKLLKIEDYYN